MTEAERKLWWILRRKQLEGFRFRRQAPLGPYFADFFCAKARLVVEIDGARHTTEEQIAHDERRTHWLETHGLRVVRFTNAQVLWKSDYVAGAIYISASAPFRRTADAARHLPPRCAGGRLGSGFRWTKV